METITTDGIVITNTTNDDWNDVLWLFGEAMKLQGKNGYHVWEAIDMSGLKCDIENKLQYKILKGNDMLCIFSIQFCDPYIWKDRDQNDAIYLHRIVVNPNFKGQKQFQHVLFWAKQFIRAHNLRFIRMDTWADNNRIIDYYKSFGFRFVGNCQTTDVPELPIQNRNLNLALLEIELTPK